MPAWSLERARHTYSVPYWSDGYFDIDGSGRLVARPHGEGGPGVALVDVVERARGMGHKLPLLVRFSDVLGHRLGKLQEAFAGAMRDLEYTGGYTAVYPIKVNQHAGVAGELARVGAPVGEAPYQSDFGLEAGSKPELMAVLALARTGSLVVCNGYKDREFIRLALMSRNLGLDTVIVIEKPSEVGLIIEESRELGIAPVVGIRLRLASLGAGKWQNSGGDKAKFGLSPRQVLDAVEKLQAAGLGDSVAMLHFHMGSQISNVRDIASGMREAVRYYVELCKRGCPIRLMDSGGGLGVDYEGTRSRSFCSINYGLDQYAYTLLQPLAEACAEHGLLQPRLITEAGRAMTAHHALMVVNVSEVEQAPVGNVPAPERSESSVIRHLREIHAELDVRPPVELFHEAQHFLAEGQALFALGQLDVGQRALLDDLFYAIAHAVRQRLNAEEKSHRSVLDELNERLVDKYFVNFSVFESIPDVWAIEQVFPIVPIDRLNEEPTRRGVIADLTCDSDGRIDTYVESEALDTSLPLHALKSGEPYMLAIAMVGAYQETLGDIHNLFGDTDTVAVSLDGAGGYTLKTQRHGDTTDVMLDYVGYPLADVRARYRDKVDAAGLPAATAAEYSAALEAGLTGYTYLSEEPLE
jgi:arginine decarboxylase